MHYFARRFVVIAVLMGAASFSELGWSAPPDSEAADLFNSKCAACHGSDGAGTSVGRSLKAPDMRSAAVQSQSDTQLKEIIKGGRNNMPSFGDLSDAQIDGLVAHIRSFAKKSGQATIKSKCAVQG